MLVSKVSADFVALSTVDEDVFPMLSVNVAVGTDADASSLCSTTIGENVEVPVVSTCSVV
jgi:hypothetical protein